MALALLTGAAVPGRVDVPLSGLRSQKGLLFGCMTAKPDMLAKCDKDPDARTARAPATAGRLVFENVPDGNYAMAALHDENGNGKLDTIFGIPREGFGFSRNPVIRTSTPTFAVTMFSVKNGANVEAIRIRYMF